MIALLSKIFIKNKNVDEARKAYGTLCSIVGICLNILLFIGKYVVGTLCGSVAITADAFNNLSDAGSSFITLVGFIFADKEPDPDHPFGHGRFEYLSGFVVSVAILLMGFELLKSSVSKILHPEVIQPATITMVILLVSILVKLYMAYYNFTVGKNINSAAMKATGTDSLSDSVATTVVLITMMIARFTQMNLDGYCGVLVALFILYAGWQAAKDTVDPLLGLAPDPEFVKRVQDIVLDHEMICGIHDMVVHDYGPGRRMISLHAEVPGNMDVFVIHDQIDHIERELAQELSCEAVIHMDPIEMDNEEVARMKNIIASEVKKIDENMTIHDFRMVAGPTHTNLIFDVVAPYELKLSEKEIEVSVQELVSNLDGEYWAVVQVDRSYI